MTQIFRFGFPLELFTAAPKSHRLGYLMLGQLWNDTIVLTKQMLVLRNKPREGIAIHDQHAQTAVEFLNLRLFASDCMKARTCSGVSAAFPKIGKTSLTRRHSAQ